MAEIPKKSMPHQPSLFDCLETGETLRDKGMQQAIDHANEVEEKWSEKAYVFLLKWLRFQEGEFMAEQVREASVGLIPSPPSDRAFGAIFRRAAMEGKIKRVGYGQVSNPKAHMANAATWIKC